MQIQKSNAENVCHRMNTLLVNSVYLFKLYLEQCMLSYTDDLCKIHTFCVVLENFSKFSYPFS